MINKVILGIQILLAAVIVGGIINLSACQTSTELQTVKIGDRTIQAAKDKEVFVSIDEKTGPTTNRTSNSGATRAAGIATDGDVSGWNAETPTLTIGGSQAGSGSVYGSVASAMKNPATIFFILAAVAGVAALPVLVYVSKPIGVLLFVCAGGLLGTGLLATYAPILFGISLLSILGIVGFMYFDSNWKAKVTSAFTTVVDKIEKMPEEKQKELKATIKEADKDGTVKEVVTELKKAI